MRFKKPLSAALLVTTAALGGSVASGCVENRSSLFVAAALAIDPTDDTCTVEASPDGTFRSQGLLDLNLSSGYTIVALLGNQMRALGDKNLLRTETNRVQIEGVEVDVAPLTGGGESGSFTIPLAGTVNPDRGTEAGYTSLFVEILPRGFIRTPGTYEARMTFFGRTLGGTEIEAGEFAFSVEVCEGCLGPDDCDDPVTVCPVAWGQDTPPCGDGS